MKGKKNKMKINENKIIIHLKHPAIPKKGLSVSITTGWSNIAKHSTLCWTTITKNMKVTDDISKVTCKKCLKIIAKDKRVAKYKGVEK